MGRGVPAECGTGVFLRLHAIDARRLRESRPWVVFVSILGPNRSRAGGVLEFAFCYPYSYESVCATVDALARAKLG